MGKVMSVSPILNKESKQVDSNNHRFSLAMSSIWNFIQSVFQSNAPRQNKILLLGFNNAGKTSILSKCKLEVTTLTIGGFPVENAVQKNLNFLILDVGGDRSIWQSHVQDSDAIIFVVDSNDRVKIDDELAETYTAKSELHYLLNLCQTAALLVFANKQDLSEAMSVEEVKRMLDLENICESRNWSIQGCSADTGEGLLEGFSWLSSALSYRDEHKHS
jgi:ADP-ribosylation factor protein 1